MSLDQCTMWPLRVKYPGAGAAFSASLPPTRRERESKILGSLVRNSQESYIEGTRAYIYKKQTCCGHQPHRIWVWAVAKTDQRISWCYSGGPDQASGSRVTPFHPQPCIQGPAIVFWVNRQSNKWEMELGLGLELLLGAF